MTLTLGAPQAFAETLDLGQFGDPCTSESARSAIVEHLFLADRETKPVVFDIGAKRKIMASLDAVIKGHKEVPDRVEGDAVRREAIRTHCRADVSQKLGGERHPDFNRLYQETMKNARVGRVSPALKKRIEADYKNWRANEEERLQSLHEADQDPAVQKAARELKAKLMKSNTVGAKDLDALTTFLTRHGPASGVDHVMGWEYAVEKDKMTGAEHVVAYRALYGGNGCVGYQKMARVTNMPAYKLPMKYFDAAKVKSWTRDGYIPGMNTYDFASVPLNFAEFQHSCSKRAPDGLPEGGAPLKDVKAH